MKDYQPMPSTQFNPQLQPQQLPDGSLIGSKQDLMISSSCIPQLISAQARETPSALAVTCGRVELTYKLLEARAAQLAHELISLGVGPETIVGLYTDRSAAMVIGALAILKAGGAYLPLDPDLPDSRVSFMLNDSDVRMVLASKHLTNKLPVRVQHIIPLDVEGLSETARNVETFDSQSQTSNLAYVIYTSGSTGTPKGVEVTHGNLLNLISWHRRAFHVSADDRASQLASPGFDAAIWEVWPYLTAGASVHIANDEVRGDAAALRDWLVEKQITLSFVPTPIAERMMSLEWPANTRLRILLTGADVLHKYPPATLPFDLYNNYGPTECTVVVASGLVTSNQKAESLPPLGRPIDNVRIHILNERLEQVPVGTSGEIFVGGASVARQYLHAPDLTRAKFVKDPFNPAPEARLYRTGDLGRILNDGQIAFIGRIDDQIKIRGYRIEPQEIVVALNEQNGITSSAVVAREDRNDNKYLAAYLVCSANFDLTATLLQDRLRKRLPEYMVPSVFIKMDALPVNASGKIDRTKLPEASSSNIVGESHSGIPRTLIQQRISAILAELLEIDHIGLSDNFFLLGGHSLLAAQLIGSIRETFGVDLPLRTIFDMPTIAGLSERIESCLISPTSAISPNGDREGVGHGSTKEIQL